MNQFRPINDGEIYALLVDLTHKLDDLVRIAEAFQDKVDSLIGYYNTPMTISETARFLKISPSMLYKMISCGTFSPGEHYIQLGDRKLFVCGEELMRRVREQQRKKPKSPLHH